MTRRKKSFEHIDSNIASLVQDNIAWGVATRVANHVVQAARISFDAGADLLTEDVNNLSPYKKGDQAYAWLQKAVDLVDAAELDGISSNVLELELEKQMHEQFVLPIRNTNFEQVAFKVLYQSSDEFALMSPSDQAKAVADKCIQFKRDEVRRDISIRDKKLQYHDIANAMLSNLINPSENMVVTGTGDYEEYLESRGKAINARITGLQGKSARIDGEWINRFDFNGNPVESDAASMDGYIIALIDEGARLGYKVPEYPKTQAQVDAAFKAFKSAS